MALGQRRLEPIALVDFRSEPLDSPPPASWAERACNIVRWTDVADGGRFAAMEQPGAFIEDVLAWASDLDGAGGS